MLVIDVYVFTLVANGWVLTKKGMKLSEERQRMMNKNHSFFILSLFFPFSPWNYHTVSKFKRINKLQRDNHCRITCTKRSSADTSRHRTKTQERANMSVLSLGKSKI